jgi:hypothetical protein
MAEEPPEGMVKCRECDGTGEMLAMRHAQDRTPLPPLRRPTCPACNGERYMRAPASVLTRDDVTAQSPKSARRDKARRP